MKQTITRLTLVVLGMLATVLVTAGPAAAGPFDNLWSGSWTYTSATTLSVQMNTVGAELVATGTDTAGVRTFNVSLTDTQSADGDCAFVSWDSQYPTSVTSCSGTVSFTPPSTTYLAELTLCRVPVDGGDLIGCNNLEVPSSVGAAFIRAAGNGFSWSYYRPEPHQKEDWQARLTIYAVEFDFYGIDNSDGTRSVKASLELNDETYNCGSGLIFAGTVPSSLSLCGGDQLQALPNTVVTGNAIGRGCMQVTRGLNPPLDCIIGWVPRAT